MFPWLKKQSIINNYNWLLFMIQQLPFAPGHLFLEFQVSLTFLNTAFIFVQTVNFFNGSPISPRDVHSLWSPWCGCFHPQTQRPVSAVLLTPASHLDMPWWSLCRSSVPCGLPHHLNRWLHCRALLRSYKSQNVHRYSHPRSALSNTQKCRHPLKAGCLR